MMRFAGRYCLLTLSAALAFSQTVPRVLQSLKGTPVPEPSALNTFVANRQVAIALGKALFWDIQVGSDGKTACASCHFQAGADPRYKNQINPGLNRVGASNFSFGMTRSGVPAGPNATMARADFPFHNLSNPQDRNSTVTYETKDVMGSQGVTLRNYLGASPGASEDVCAEAIDPIFSSGATNFRRSSARHAPTVINAAFNLRNFYDGRANPLFNGVDAFGPRNRAAVVYRGHPAVATRILLDNSSLASQATAPPMSDIEMSCAGRTWPETGKRLLSAAALKRQSVAADDSVLAGYVAPAGQKGLSVTYERLVREAFVSDLWSSTSPVIVNGKTYSQAEANFSLFFGLAVQLYESTLVSDDAPIDRYFAAYPSTNVANPSALTSEEIAGLNVFLGKGKCITCHSGPELTNAGTPSRLAAQQGVLVDRMTQGDGTPGAYDFGFYNIGVRPTSDDIGLGGNDPWGQTLSYTRQAVSGARWDPFSVDPCKFTLEACTPLASTARVTVDGAFKTPTLRNIALTGPYFHNGSRASLEEVIEFYNRGGDRRGTLLSDNSGYGANASNIGPDIRSLSLLEFEKSALLAFLKNALTDERVRWERAPFDHPELPLADGHTAEFVLLPAVGRGGRRANPLRSFEEVVAAGTLGYAPVSLSSLNSAPSVSLLFPAAGAVFTAPASISISAAASDPDQNLSKVEFFQGAQKLGEAQATPYLLQWANVAAGTYTITARATDSGGLTASASVTVTVAAPAAQPAALTTIVNAASGLCADIYGSVSIPSIPAVTWACQNTPSQKFRFEAVAGGNSIFRIVANHSNLCLEVQGGTNFSGAALVQQVCTGSTHQQFRIEAQAPANWRISAIHSGKALTARGQSIEQHDWTGESAQQWRIGGVRGPAVSITSPAAGASFAAPAQVRIDASAANAARVEFFEGSTRLGEDATAPYTFTWNQAAPGWYTIEARATDAEGRIASAAVRVRVMNGVVSTIANQATGNCMDTFAGRVVQWTCNGGEKQALRVAPVGTGEYSIQVESGGACLQMQAGIPVMGACANLASQRFRLEKQADGAYRISSVSSGKVLAAAGTRLEEQAWNGQSSQKWLITGLNE
jgi:cytochrome c peroxidase